MNDDIQKGDTVEILVDCVDLPHPLENRLLTKGDRIVVCFATMLFVYYRTNRSADPYYLSFNHVKKVVSNQVEIKFR
jgi:hypothetical protein